MIDRGVIDARRGHGAGEVLPTGLLGVDPHIKDCRILQYLRRETADAVAVTVGGIEWHGADGAATGKLDNQGLAVLKASLAQCLFGIAHLARDLVQLNVHHIEHVLGQSAKLDLGTRALLGSIDALEQVERWVC